MAGFLEKFYFTYKNTDTTKFKIFDFYSRSFTVTEPNLWETEGIKCYTMCPVYADTNLISSGIEKTKEKVENGIISPDAKEAQVKNVTDIEKQIKVRMLTIEEIGDCFVDCLKYDKVFNIYMLQIDRFVNSY